MEKQGWNQSRNKESAEEMERSRVAFNLRRMRTSYTMGDLLEERSRGVSTELSLSHYDPFTIKKKMKPSDLGNLCRLLVPSDLAEKHILPFLNTAQADQVAGVVSRQETNRGLKVRVWDVNTGSMHRLVFKRWSTSRSYIFNDGWTKDFVKRRNLAEGDEIGIYWDKDQSRFTFSVLSRACLAR
ncbi:TRANSCRIPTION FACTOR B3-DOMAIN FAMILY-RELATED [Salix viminalis]|uniref:TRANSCRIPTION FACTOR B3-DOMAIN FAMILY-RELATED n=1 Tax=Salix viminalis TaxID=40686 RepID=A0A6N2LAD9_SALVM|nr:TRANSCRIPTION FACTOR B3-DOMAIN FAMILY-RELATED [Salix viminalis]